MFPLQLQHLDKICKTRLSICVCTNTKQQSLPEKCHTCFGSPSGFWQPGVWGDKYKSWMISVRSLTSTNPTYMALCSRYSYITLFLKFDFNSRELLQFLLSTILYNSFLFFFALYDAELSRWWKTLFFPLPSLKCLTILLKPFNNYYVFQSLVCTAVR